jgi:hypothetical protein
MTADRHCECRRDTLRGISIRKARADDRDRIATAFQ